MKFGINFAKDESPKINKKLVSRTKAIKGITKLIPRASINEDDMKINNNK